MATEAAAPQELDREIETLCDRIHGWELAFLLDEEAEIWEGGRYNPEVLQRWVWVVKNMKNQGQGDGDGEQIVGSMMPSVVGGGVGGGRNFTTAQEHMKKGEQLFNAKDYNQARDAFKQASNWYFKAGDRKLSEAATDWVKKARASSIEQGVQLRVGNQGECYCVCEQQRLVEILARACKRLGSCKVSWRPRNEHELSLHRGDTLKVLGKDEEATAAFPDTVCYRGILDGREGVFPTTQLLYKASGRPQLDEDGTHISRTIVSLDSTEIFQRYASGRPYGPDWNPLKSDVAAFADEAEGEDADDGGFGGGVARAGSSETANTNPPGTANTEFSRVPSDGADARLTQRVKSPGSSDDPFGGGDRSAAVTPYESARTPARTPAIISSTSVEEEAKEDAAQQGALARGMDYAEFRSMLIDLRIAAPLGHRPTAMQVSHAAALLAFRQANRDQGDRDADQSQLDFEEFRIAMIALREVLKIPEHESELEDTCPVGHWTCLYAAKTFTESIRDLNKAHVLMRKVDPDWTILLKAKVRKLAVKFGEFQESHARILTQQQKFQWAFDRFAMTKTLYSGATGSEDTRFEPLQSKLLHLNRGLVVNQYIWAMQLMKLSAPNSSSHLGIPPYIGDPSEPLREIKRAQEIFEGMDDHIAIATTVRAAAELALRMGKIEEALVNAKRSEDEFSRLNEPQGLASAYRLMGDVLVVDGQVSKAIGSLQAGLQISADAADHINECSAHQALGAAQLWLSNLEHSDAHFVSCIALSTLSNQIEQLGHATAGRGRVAIVIGRFDDGLDFLADGKRMLEACGDRWGVAKIMFEEAEVAMLRQRAGWKRGMEDASNLLTRTIPRYQSQQDDLMVARARAQAWVFRVTARQAIELRSRMLEGETLGDTMRQLSWEALQEGKSVLQAIAAVGDKLTRTEVLLKVAEMQMLGMRSPEIVMATIDDLETVFKLNASPRGIAKAHLLRASALIFKRQYLPARLEAEAAARRLNEAQMHQGVDVANCQWTLAITKRLAGEAGEGRAEMAHAIQHYKEIESSRLCSLCSMHIYGACYTCLECYQRDYCKECYAECALNGRSCHKTSAMIRAIRPL